MQRREGESARLSEIAYHIQFSSFILILNHINSFRQFGIQPHSIESAGLRLQLLFECCTELHFLFC